MLIALNTEFLTIIPVVIRNERFGVFRNSLGLWNSLNGFTVKGFQRAELLQT